MKIFKANKRAVAMFSIALLLVAIVFGVVYAKYVGNLKDRQGVVPESFVFTSDYLTEDGAEYTIYADSVTFNIQNHDVFDNKSENDIEYTISVDNGGTLESKGDNTLTVADGKEEYTLSGVAGKTYTVTATSTSPYTHTIKATFKFVKITNRTSVGEYVDTDAGYFILHLYTGSEVNKDTKFHFQGDGFIPDNTNPLMRDWKNRDYMEVAGKIDGTITGLEPDSHYEFIFFRAVEGKFDPDASLSKEDFVNNEKTITLYSESVT